MFATVVAAFIGVSGALLGGLVVHSRQVLTKAEKDFANTTNALNIAYAAHDEAKVRTTLEFLTTNSFDKVTAILPSYQTRRNELVKRVNEQSDLWRVRLLGMEFSSNKSKVETNPLGVPLNWFEDFNKRLTPSSPVFGDAVDERDTLTNDWVNSRIELETKCQTAHFRNVVDQERKNLASAKPDAIIEPLRKSKTLIADAVTYALVTNRAELCNSLGLITARTNAIAKYVDSKVGRPDDDKRPDDTEKLRQSVSKDLKNALTTMEFDALSIIISKRNDVALKAWDTFHFPKRVKELENALNAAGSNPSRSLTESLAFLSTMTNSYPAISQLEFIKARNIIEGARKKAIEYYENSIAKGWDVNGRKPPEFDVETVRLNVLKDAAFTEDEYELFRMNMLARFEAAKKEWTNLQNKKVEDFIWRHLSSEANVVSALNTYMTEREEYLRNPGLSRLDKKMQEVLEKRLDEIINGYHKEFRGEKNVWAVSDNRAVRMKLAQDKFNELKQLCLALANRLLDNTPIEKSWCAKFAKLCKNRGTIDRDGIRGAFQQRFDIAAIDVKVDFASTPESFAGLSFGAYVHSRYWVDGEGVKDSAKDLVDVSKRRWTLKENQGGKWWRLWKGKESLYFNPWTNASVEFAMEDRGVFQTCAWNLHREDEREGYWHKGYIEFKHHMDVGHSGTHTTVDITFRIHGTYSGPDLKALRDEARR